MNRSYLDLQIIAVGYEEDRWQYVLDVLYNNVLSSRCVLQQSDFLLQTSSTAGGLLRVFFVFFPPEITSNKIL